MDWDSNKFILCFAFVVFIFLCFCLATLEEMRVVDRMSDDSAIIHQVHKRVWPASQRESLFWSHFRRMSSMADPNASDLLVVCNHDTQHKDVPVSFAVGENECKRTISCLYVR